MIVRNSLFDRDLLMFCKSGILIFIFAENNYSIYAQAMLIKTPLLHQSFGPRVFLSFFLPQREPQEQDCIGFPRKPGDISLFLSLTFLSSSPDHQVPVHQRTNTKPLTFSNTHLMWYIYTMEYCIHIKRNEIMTFAAT